MSELIQCPIRGKFYFLEPLSNDVEEGKQQCLECGWIFDERQIENPDYVSEDRPVSLNEYKRSYLKKITANPKYSYIASSYVPSKHLCPVCGRYKFKDYSSFEICPFCGWEDDGSEVDDSDILGPNDLRYSEYKKRYEALIENDPSYKWKRNN